MYLLRSSKEGILAILQPSMPRARAVAPLYHMCMGGGKTPGSYLTMA